MGKPKFNKTDIDWCEYTWNPVTGCQHGCKYCYARIMANRRMGAYKDTGFEPHLHEARLEAPANTNVPYGGINRVFVCSMADLFGEWVPAKWINQVLRVCHDNDKWEYWFLTKNPARLKDFKFPYGTHLGATVDTQERLESSVQALRAVEEELVNRFISFEPLMSDISGDLKGIDLAVIGAMTGRKKMLPKPEWVGNLIALCARDKVDVLLKDNLGQIVA